LSSTFVIVDELRRFGDRYGIYAGAQPRAGDGELTFDFPLCSRLTIMTPAVALRRLPGTLYPPLPGIAAVGFRCPDREGQARRLRDARIPFAEVDGTLVVPAEAASGIAVVFE
jgi:hypothetical protein